MTDLRSIDLHMHSTVSDGTDAPAELLARVRDAGLPLFALTDHDAVKGCGMIRSLRRPDDPRLLTGVEFSCRDEEGNYHILGYGFNLDSPAIRRVIETGHRYRMEKVAARLDYLQNALGLSFPEREIQNLLALDNPGKPHFANLMVKYGYAGTKEQAISGYIDRAGVPDACVRPEEAIRGILEGGGVPVLAHPGLGRGDEHIVGDAMARRLRRLIDYGLQGIEAFYSTFTPQMRAEALAFAEAFGLYVTAGSDYHGGNKPIALGDTKLGQAEALPDGMRRFLERVGEWR